MTELINVTSFLPKSKPGSHKHNNTHTNTHTGQTSLSIQRVKFALQTGMLCSPHLSSHTHPFAFPPHRPAHTGQRGSVCNKFCLRSCFSYLLLSLSPCEGSVLLACLPNQFGDGEQVSVYYFSVHFCVRCVHPCGGWLFQCNYLFFCVVLSVFVSKSPTFLFFSLSVSLSFSSPQAHFSFNDL